MWLPQAVSGIFDNPRGPGVPKLIPGQIKKNGWPDDDAPFKSAIGPLSVANYKNHELHARSLARFFI